MICNNNAQKSLHFNALLKDEDNATQNWTDSSRRIPSRTGPAANLFALTIRLLEVASFFVRTNRQSLPTLLSVKQLALHEHRISLFAEILDVRARRVKILRNSMTTLHVLFKNLKTEFGDATTQEPTWLRMSRRFTTQAVQI